MPPDDTASTSIDPTTKAVITNSLQSACGEVADVLIRTARNPAFSTGHDFSVAITDSETNLVTGEEGLPIHLAAIDECVGAMAHHIDYYQDGDVIVTNDPYDGWNSHMSDFTMSKPVYGNDTNDPVVWLSVRAHQSDVGATDPVSMPTTSTEIFQEGIRIPPTRIVKGGERQTELINLITKNSRVESMMRGDVLAMLGAMEKGTELVHQLLDRYDPSTVRASILELLHTTEASMIDYIEELPDGTYRGKSQADTNPDTRQPVEFVVDLTVDGDAVTFDFSESDEQLAASTNNSLGITYACTRIAWFTVGGFDFPMNAGAFEMVDIVAPKGLVVNPEFPTGTGYATVSFAQETIEACWNALAGVRPENVPGGHGRWVRPIASGNDPQSGKQYAQYHLFVLPGAGAVRGQDGANRLGGSTLLGGLCETDPEMQESLLPFHIHEVDLRTDSGGAGAWRGGLGCTVKIAPVDHTSLFSIGGDFGQSNPPNGILGGQDGEPAAISIERSDGSVEEIPHSFVDVPVEDGERYIQRSAGGGGVGDPMRRDPERVREDVKHGYVSVEAAAEMYGVAIDGETLAIDDEETDRLRGANDEKG